jgi:PAS domain S-box-containing protein
MDRDRASGDAQLAAIVQHSSDAIVSKDLDGVVRSWNAAAERLFGWTAAEMVGRSIRRVIPEDRQAEEDAILARIRAGEIVPKFETLRLHRDGTAIPLAITVSPIRDADGKVVGASKIANDLREMTDLRRELRESQRQFEALAQNIPQLAWMADSKGWIYWYNQRWYDYTGTTLEDMQGWGWKAVHHPDHVDRVVERIQQAWDTGEDWEDTFPLRGTDGEFRWFLSRASALKDDAGNVILWCGTNTDITEQRESNERIRLLMDEVNHRARNILATIQAIVRQTMRGADGDLVAALDRRIEALSANHDLLSDQNWSGVLLRDLVVSQVSHVGGLADGRIELSGPDGLRLQPRPAEALGLAIHELATNAMKYGALSVPEGRVAVSWSVEGKGAEATFRMAWRESGGPPVEPPTRTGFGSVIIARNPQMALRGTVEWRPEPDGVVWTVSAPADGVVLG